MDSVVQSITFEDIVMKIKNVLNPFGITMEDFRNPAFQEGLIGSLLWFIMAVGIGWLVAFLMNPYL
jgi:hypothetical protein